MKFVGLSARTEPEELFRIMIKGLVHATQDDFADFIKRGMKINTIDLRGLSYQMMAKLMYLILNANFATDLDPRVVREYLGDINFVYRLLSLMTGNAVIQGRFVKYIREHCVWTQEFLKVLLSKFCTRKFAVVLDCIIEIEDSEKYCVENTNENTGVNLYDITDISWSAYGKLIFRFPQNVILQNIDAVTKNIAMHIDYKSLEEVLTVVPGHKIKPAFDKYFNVLTNESLGIMESYGYGNVQVSPGQFIYCPAWAPSAENDFKIINMVKVMVSNGTYDIRWNEFLKWDRSFCEKHLRAEMFGLFKDLDITIAVRCKGPYKRLYGSIGFNDLMIVCSE